MKRTCEYCGQPFEARRSTRKTCSERCRAKLNARKRRLAAVGVAAAADLDPVPVPVAAEPRPNPLLEAVTRDLAKAGQLTSPMGLMILVLAERLGGLGGMLDTATGVVALSKELSRLLAEVLHGAEVENDPIDELTRRRLQKAAQAGE